MLQKRTAIFLLGLWNRRTCLSRNNDRFLVDPFRVGILTNLYYVQRPTYSMYTTSTFVHYSRSVNIVKVYKLRSFLICSCLALLNAETFLLRKLSTAFCKFISARRRNSKRQYQVEESASRAIASARSLSPEPNEGKRPKLSKTKRCATTTTKFLRPVCPKTEILSPASAALQSLDPVEGCLVKRWSMNFEDDILQPENPKEKANILSKAFFW